LQRAVGSSTGQEKTTLSNAGPSALAELTQIAARLPDGHLECFFASLPKSAPFLICSRRSCASFSSLPEYAGLLLFCHVRALRVWIRLAILPQFSSDFH
jgi:hypothetical protein